MEDKKTAVLFGAGGLVGSHLLQELLASDRYAVVLTFVRRSTGIAHVKLRERVHPLTDIGEIAGEIRGDDLFLCLGTTMKKAGSKEAFTKVDLELPWQIASAAAQNGCSSLVLVSSIGADPGSSSFYLRVKGQLEKKLEVLPVRNKVFLRPSFLLGRRREFRLGETVGRAVWRFLEPLMTGRWKRYRSIEAATVAKAMIRAAAFPEARCEVWESDRVAEEGSRQ